MTKVRIRVKKPWIGYPGTPIQQNYGEALDHGYLLWDIEDKNSFDVKFCELPNPRPYVTLEWAGDVEKTIASACRYPKGSRFRIRSKDVLAQKEISTLTQELQAQHHASEVTFKNDHVANRELISAGAATFVRDDLRSPDVLLKLLKGYYRDSRITEAEWDAVREQVSHYLVQALGSDDFARNTKWSLRYLAFDNAFTYGEGNCINFDQLPGIIGIFGPNRAGKSSIVGTIMYSLFNTTDRGSVKNLHVINVRKPYCYTKAIISAGGHGYVIERQTVKHENRYGHFHANTNLNVFKISEDGTLEDLAGEERKDTDRVIKKLIGSADDALLTNVAAQDDIKQYINQGSTRRRQTLSRFLDLDIFDKMYNLANDDVKANRAAVKTLPDRDWPTAEKEHSDKLEHLDAKMTGCDHQLHVANQRLDELRRQLMSFRDFTPVTQTQVEKQRAWIASLEEAEARDVSDVAELAAEITKLQKTIDNIDGVLRDNDLGELKKRLDAYKTLEASVDNLKLLHEKDAAALKQQERSLKILDDVPCGDQFPTCRFIRDAHKHKEKVEPQRERVQKALEKLEKAEAALATLKHENLVDKVSKLEQLDKRKGELQLKLSEKQITHYKLTAKQSGSKLQVARKQLAELEEALKNEENAEVVSLRHDIDELQRLVKQLDAEKLSLASQVGRVQSDLHKTQLDRKKREDLLQLMKAHELVAQAFSKKGIPNLIITSQLPIINSEISKILNGIVDFNIELEIDDDDSMEVYINYGDSRRPIELGSGMEKMIASLAIRVALVNVSSLPKSDMFIIDEGFGSLDDAGVEACNRLLISLKRYFKNIIVITHVEGVKDVADHVIEITKVEKDARVVYSETWPNDRTSEIG